MQGIIVRRAQTLIPNRSGGGAAAANLDYVCFGLAGTLFTGRAAFFYSGFNYFSSFMFAPSVNEKRWGDPPIEKRKKGADDSILI